MLFKKLLLSLILGVFVTNCFAYSPTNQDEVLLNKTYQQLDQIIQSDSKKAESLATKLDKYKKKYSQYPRVYYVLNQIEEYINQKLEENKDELEDMFLSVLGKNSETKNEIYKSEQSINNKDQNLDLERKKAFYEMYGGEIVGEQDIDIRCIEKYDFIDNIAKENDFPTALVIATWRIENSCIFANPSNRHGLFQLWSWDWGVGSITEDDFKAQMVDMINFSKNKRQHYENKEKWEPGTIKITYNEYDFESLRLHGLIYNGLYSGHTPENSKYVNGNLNPSHIYKKDGIITSFLKVVKWEIENGKY